MLLLLLLSQGHSVVVYDVDSSAVSALSSKGAVAAASPAEVAAQSDRLVTMLPNNDIVRAVYTSSDGGVLGSVKKGALLVDSSTIDPAVSKEMSAAASAAGAAFVDAPVSGGVNAAAAGTLTFMVGAASDAEFKRAEELLGAMGKSITHCGDVGTGQAVKICNNMLLAVSMIGVSETMNLGQK